MTAHIVAIGGTSRIAHLCLREWTRSGEPLVSLVGRDPERLNSVAADIIGRNPGTKVQTFLHDLRDLASVPNLVERIRSQQTPSIALVAHGYLPAPPVENQGIQELSDTLTVTGLSATVFAEYLARAMHRDGGQLGIIGSVAGDRGRRRNYPYGAAKSMLAHYSQGLQHRYWDTSLSITLVKPGPTATPMTAGTPSAGGRLADPSDVAGAIVRSMSRGQRVCYTPSIWRLVMLGVRNLPTAVFNRLNL